MYDVNFNVHILLCGHYKTIEDNNLKCQTLMWVLFFRMMLILVYVLCRYCEATRDKNPRC
jgi:hypothetical protein